jgi:hypothetical protein
MISPFEELINSCRSEGISWDVDEAGIREDALNSAAGAFSIKCSELLHAQSMKLLVCFSAYRSLLTWFRYCRDVRPLRLIEYGIDCVLEERNAIFSTDSLEPVIPFDGNKRIADCRLTDTLSASTSVAYSCRYLASGDIFDFIVSISYAHVAFEVSPVHRSEVYESWLCKIALPIAQEHRKLHFDESFAMSNFAFDESGNLFIKP